MKYKLDKIDKATIAIFIILYSTSAVLYYVGYKKSENKNMYLKAVSECAYGAGEGFGKKYRLEGYETKEDCIESKFDLFKKVGL